MTALCLLLREERRRFLGGVEERFFRVMNREENEGCKLALAPLVESMSYAMQTLIISLVRARASWCIGRKLLWDPSIG